VSGPSVAVVVQARMSSRRLPGKVLKPLAGAPAIVRMMERVSHTTRARLHLVATSDRPSDDPLAEVCREHGVRCVRGPLDDVLARMLMAVPPRYDIVVRLTGDCPLIDPALVDRHVEVYLREQPWVEYVTNSVVRTQPDGLDVEVVSRALLALAEREARSEYDREHVLPWIRRRARTVPVTQETDLSRLRWTLDTAADYEMIVAVYQALYPSNPNFGSSDVYRLLVRRPELIRVEGLDRLTEGEQRDWVTRIRNHLAAVT